MTEKNQNEQKTTAASYIIGFYQSVTGLKHEYANYINIVKELETKYGKEAEKQGLSPAEKEQITQQAQNVRYFITQTYIDYTTIAKLTEEEEKKLETLYNKATTKLYPEITTLTPYVKEINKILTKEIIQDLLKTSQDILNEVYGEK